MTPDAVAALVLDEADPLGGRVLVIDDVGGALASAALAAGCDVRGLCDDLRVEASLPSGVLPYAWDDPWRPETVLWRLPSALSALSEVSERLAHSLSPDGRVFGGARVKHMTPTQNEVLARSFDDVTASLGRQKARVRRATGPRPGPLTWPRTRVDVTSGLTVVAHGSTFNTNRLDAGTRLLLGALAREGSTGPGRALDLGCGSGILAAWLAARGWSVTASDVSAAAIASTRATAAANGVSVDARRTDGLTDRQLGRFDRIVSNPPFHVGAAKDSTPTLAMIAAAPSALTPGGELWLVFNSHLPYLSALRQHVGPTEVVGRNRHYTVTRSRRRAADSPRPPQLP